MSHLQYYAYEGVGKRNRQAYRYNQAVRVGDKIECSGQGGWDPETGEIDTEISAQIAQAFANVERCLRYARGQGWQQVFRVNSYHLPLNNEAFAIMTKWFQSCMPDHMPIWTAVGVQRLGEDDMRVEIEVVAHDPKGK